MSLLTSKNLGQRSIASRFGSDADSNYLNALQNKVYQNKLTSQCLQNKFQMTGHHSKNTLGETYEISEDIHISQTNDQLSNKINNLTQKAKEIHGIVKPTNLSEQQQPIKEIKESRNSSSEKQSVERESKKKISSGDKEKDEKIGVEKNEKKNAKENA